MRPLVIILLLASALGCSKTSSPTGPPAPPDTTTTPAETPFSFHKPRLGATFTIEAIQLSGGAIEQDTTFLYRVSDTSATHDGRSGVLAFAGYYVPFFVSYRSSGDIDVWGDCDYIAGHQAWTWYPLALPAGAKAQTYIHDSIISNPDPNDTREVIRDSLQVVGRETLTINGQPIECIRALVWETDRFTSLKYGFSTSGVASMDYWYAPSLGYWAKEHIADGPTDITFQLTDYTP